jgi:predicted deacylase
VPGRLRFEEVFSGKGGIVSSTKRPGDEVHAGELLSLIRNPYGDVVEEIRSPAEGWLLGYPVLQNQSVFTGDTAVYLAVPLA